MLNLCQQKDPVSGGVLLIHLCQYGNGYTGEIVSWRKKQVEVKISQCNYAYYISCFMGTTVLSERYTDQQCYTIAVLVDMFSLSMTLVPGATVRGTTENSCH